MGLPISTLGGVLHKTRLWALSVDQKNSISVTIEKALHGFQRVNFPDLKDLPGAFATTISTRGEQQIVDLGGRSLNHESALVVICNHPMKIPVL